jgi:hypothetical protein
VEHRLVEGESRALDGQMSEGGVPPITVQAKPINSHANKAKNARQFSAPSCLDQDHGRIIRRATDAGYSKTQIPSTPTAEVGGTDPRAVTSATSRLR